MRCPKCDAGTIDRIKFKRTGRVAFLCDFCDTLWFDGENIDFSTGRDFELFLGSQDHEYTLDDLSEKNQEHGTVNYVHHK